MKWPFGPFTCLDIRRIDPLFPVSSFNLPRRFFAEIFYMQLHLGGSWFSLGFFYCFVVVGYWIKGNRESMGAESITPPAPAIDKSQNPGDIFHSFYHFCMIDVMISNGVLFVSHAIGCFYKWNSIWLITGPFVSSFQLQFGWLRRQEWMVIPFFSTL